MALRGGGLRGTAAGAARGVVAVDANGRTTRNVEFAAKLDRTEFRTRKGEFAYRVSLAAGR